MSRWLLTLLTLSTVAVALVLAIACPGALSRHGTFARSAAAVPATSTPWAYIDKLNNGDGWCDPNHIDTTTTEYVGDFHQFALCVGNLTLQSPVRSFQATIGYDGALDRCIDEVCEPLTLGAQTVRLDDGCVDDNPDANAGDTIWGDGLGDNWNCFFVFADGSNLGNFDYMGEDPTCELPDHGSTQLSAGISCHGLDSFTLGDDETWGALAIVNMDVIAAGVDNVDIQSLRVYTESVEPIIVCPLVDAADVNVDTVIEEPCQGATDIKRTPIRHRSPTPTPKPPATPTTEPTLPPPPSATPTPSGGAGPVIVAPITGSGPTGSDAPWALWLATGIACAALATGGFYIRHARSDR